MFRRIIQTLLQKLRHLLYLCWTALPERKYTAADVSIDVVILAIEANLPILPYCIEGLRKNVQHRIQQIYLVAPPRPLMMAFAAEHGLQFVDENTVLGYGPANINYTITVGPFKGLNRSGWIFQQLVKLAGKVGKCRYYLTIDADHILLQPHVFVTADQRTVMYRSSEYNIPYYQHIHQLLHRYPAALFSYVSHKMLFDREALKKLHAAIEKQQDQKTDWDKIIIGSLNPAEVSQFSEFELYGNYLPAAQQCSLPWKEKMLPIKELAAFDELVKRYPGYRSVTFPDYLQW